MNDAVTDRSGAVRDAMTSCFFLLIWCFPMALGIAWFSLMAWAKWTGFNALDRSSRPSGDS